MIRIVLVDDQTLVRQGIRSLLELSGDIEIVAEASDGEEGLVVIRRERPDVVLLDVRMPKKGGIDVLRELQAEGHGPPAILLTTFDDDEVLLEGMKAGARGYLLKDVSSETLVSAIQAATRGESFLQSTVTGRVVAAFARLMESGGPKAEALVLPLSPREREIVSLLGSGASNKEIADRLNLAEGTVKNYVTNILTKLDVRDRTQAAIRARQLGIV